MARRMDIEIPNFKMSSKTEPYRCQTFSSTIVHSIDLTGEVSGNIPETADINVVVEKKKCTYDVAVCIPSKPLEVISLKSIDWSLRKWWEEWRHNIAVDVGPRLSSHVGPIFLVLEKTVTDQFTNCYYAGQESSASLRILGKVANLAKLAFEAGYKCTQIRGFDFIASEPRSNGEKWSIFIRNEKLIIAAFSKFKYLAIQAWQFVEPFECTDL
jgi:hypothetical protein